MQRFREPVSGFMHLAALVLSVVGTIALAWAFHEDGPREIAGLVFGGSMCACFLASSAHHLIKADRKVELWLRRLDYAAIFPFIAGSYTPICLYLVHDRTAVTLLGIVWGVALLGVVYMLFLSRDPVHVSDPPDLACVGIYVAMGWLAVFKLPDLLTHSTGGTFTLMAIGGLSYTIGGVILSKKLFDFWPGKFGHHEIWHACVMAGACCFYSYVFLNLAT